MSNMELALWLRTKVAVRGAAPVRGASTKNTIKKKRIKTK